MGVQASRVPHSVSSSSKEEFELPSLNKLVREMEVTVEMYFTPGTNSAYESVHDVTVRCIKSASRIYGAEEARKDSVGFEWNPVKLANDLAAIVICKYEYVQHQYVLTESSSSVLTLPIGFSPYYPFRSLDIEVRIIDLVYRLDTS